MEKAKHVSQIEMAEMLGIKDDYIQAITEMVDEIIIKELNDLSDNVKYESLEDEGFNI